MRYTSMVDFRNAKRMSQPKMAEMLGISLSHYSKIELGLRSPSYGFIVKLKEKFPEFDVNIFFDNELHATCKKAKIS